MYSNKASRNEMTNKRDDDAANGNDAMKAKAKERKKSIRWRCGVIKDHNMLIAVVIVFIL